MYSEVLKYQMYDMYRVGETAISLAISASIIPLLHL